MQHASCVYAYVALEGGLVDNESAIGQKPLGGQDFVTPKVAQFLNRDETVETTGTTRGGTICGGLPGPNERC